MTIRASSDTGGQRTFSERDDLNLTKYHFRVTDSTAVPGGIAPNADPRHSGATDPTASVAAFRESSGMGNVASRITKADLRVAGSQLWN
jgi:hypothetical protein